MTKYGCLAKQCRQRASSIRGRFRNSASHFGGRGWDKPKGPLSAKTPEATYDLISGLEITTTGRYRSD